MTIARRGWTPCATARVKCAGCGTANTFCTVSAKGDICICRKGATSDRALKERDGTIVYFHRMDGTGGGGKPQRQDGPAIEKPKLSEGELRTIVKRHQSNLTARKLGIGCRALGLSEQALRMYGVGYDADLDALSFPMVDGDQKLVGIRTRSFGDAAKRCVIGSRNGLFVPAGFDVAHAGDGMDGSPVVLMPEGPTDAAAAWTCGYVAIGRANNTHGGPMIDRLLQRCLLAGVRRAVAVLADADATKWMPDGTPHWPGWEGAVTIADACRRFASSVVVVKPPLGAKDIRKALADTADAPAAAIAISEAIKDARPVNAAWIKHARWQLDAVKDICRATLAGRAFRDNDHRDASRREAEAMARGIVAKGTAAVERWRASTERRKAG